MTDADRNARSGRAGLLLVLALALGAAYWAWTREGEPAPPRALVDRLVERVDGARIESPLVGLALASGLDELEGAPRTTLLSEDFEALEPAARGWTGVEVRGQGHGRALFVAGMQRTRGSFIGWTFDATPGAYYRFERRARAAGEPYADFAVVESSAPASAGPPASLTELYVAGRDLAIKLHWPEARDAARDAASAADGAEPTWSRGTTSFRASAATRSLVVFLRTKVGIAEHGASDPLWFDDLAFERVEPSPEQRVALFAGADGAGEPDAVPHARFRRRGQFLPLADAETVRPPFEANFARRDVLVAPPATHMRFDIDPAFAARATFAVGLARESSAGSAARFEVALEAQGERRVLFEETLRADAATWHWSEADLELGAGASAPGAKLVLSTEALEGTPLCLWGNPTLFGAEPAPGPVILIAVDTLRADRLSCYGYARTTTPALDALAQDGVRFDHVASNSNWTCPSFASILSGMTPSRHGVDSFGPATPLPAGLITLAEAFQAAGRGTHAIAFKAPLYDGGYDQGFDVSLNVPRAAVRAEHNLDAARAWVLRDARAGGLLFLHFNDPHQPFTQPEPWQSAFGGEHGVELPFKVPAGPAGADDAAWRSTVSDLYDGEIGYVDDAIGRFLGWLREAGLYERATIAFVADHGEELWERGSFGHGGVGLGDELVRVPLIVKPARGATFEAGSVVEQQVSAFDAMPTLLELAGLPALGGLDARSLVPLLAGRAGDVDALAFSETSLTALSVRSSRWKYVFRWPQRAQTREALYDLAADPGETRDLAGVQSEVAAGMRVAALDYLLAHRPGTFAVVVGPAQGAPDLALAGVRGAEVFLGPRPVASVDGLAFRGGAQRIGGALWLVAELEGLEGAPGVTGAELRDPEPRNYVSGDLAELADPAPDVPTLWLFRGPPRPWSSAARSEVDAAQLETLRALGYAR